MTQLWVERTGTRRYIGRSTQGAQVLVGSEDVDGVFTPESCSRSHSPHAAGWPVTSRWPGGSATTTRRWSRYPVRPTATRERYPLIEETMELDLSGLTEDEKERLLVVINRAVELACTVGRTLKSGTTVNLEVVDVGA